MNTWRHRAIASATFTIEFVEHTVTHARVHDHLEMVCASDRARSIQTLFGETRRRQPRIAILHHGRIPSGASGRELTCRLLSALLARRVHVAAHSSRCLSASSDARFATTQEIGRTRGQPRRQRAPANHPSIAALRGPLTRERHKRALRYPALSARSALAAPATVLSQPHKPPSSRWSPT